MKTSFLKSPVGMLCVAALLTGCANRPAAPPAVDNAPLGVKVVYSTDSPDGGRLKDVPKEVTIVTRQLTSEVVAKHVALGVLTTLLGATTIRTFEKDDLKGVPIEDIADRSNLHNPVAKEFVSTLQSKIDAAIQADTSLREKNFRRPLVISDGFARLVYEELTGAEEERFRFKAKVSVSKRKENTSIFRQPNHIVCESTSAQLLNRKQWAESDYQLVKTELQAMLVGCEQKVLATLPSLL